MEKLLLVLAMVLPFISLCLSGPTPDELPNGVKPYFYYLPGVEHAATAKEMTDSVLPYYYFLPGVSFPQISGRIDIETEEKEKCVDENDKLVDCDKCPGCSVVKITVDCHANETVGTNETEPVGRRKKRESGVCCGGHKATYCSQCTKGGHGKNYCNGDCIWRSGKCQEKNGQDQNLLDWVYHDTNKQRSDRGISKMYRDAKLEGFLQRAGCATSHQHSQRTNMIDNYCPHDGIPCFAENVLCAGTSCTRSRLETTYPTKGWINSPGHKTNMLNSEYDRFGCSAYKCNNSGSKVAVTCAYTGPKYL